MPFVYSEINGVGYYEVSTWAGARGIFTTRKGGLSQKPFDSLNLGSGGGDDPGKTPLLRPLGLSREEKESLREFLASGLSGRMPEVRVPTIP